MELLFSDVPVKNFRAIERPARRKLLYLHRARTLQDLKVTPGNHLEALRAGPAVGLRVARRASDDLADSRALGKGQGGVSATSGSSRHRRLFSVSLVLIQQTIALILVVSLCAPILACTSRSSSRPRADISDLLWIPPGAQVVQSVLTPARVERQRNLFPDGSATLIFVLTRDCDRVADVLVTHFSRAGWGQRARHIRNPGMETGFVTGCQQTGGGIAVPTAPGPFMEWHGEWQDTGGDIVSYTIAGFSPNLHVVGRYIPYELAESWRLSLDEERARIRAHAGQEPNP